MERKQARISQLTDNGSLIYDPFWFEKNIIFQLKKENIYSENDSLQDIFFNWLCLNDYNYEKQALDWLDTEIRDLESESKTTSNGEKTNKRGQLEYFKILEIEKFGDSIENVLQRKRYNKTTSLS